MSAAGKTQKLDLVDENHLLRLEGDALRTALSKEREAKERFFKQKQTTAGMYSKERARRHAVEERVNAALLELDSVENPKEFAREVFKGIVNDERKAVGTACDDRLGWF